MAGKTDGNLELVDKKLLAAAQDVEAWLAERRKKWPTTERVAARQKEQASAPTASLPAVTGVTPAPSAVRKRPICKYFRNGRCRNGDSCRFSHELPPPKAESAAKRTRFNVYKRFEPPVKSSLFVKLVQSDHDAEDELLLDFIAYWHQQRQV